MTLKALIFDVDGTLAETEEAHRAAFNETFRAWGLGWHWDHDDYRQLLQVTGGKERIRAFQATLPLRSRRLDDAEIDRFGTEKTARYCAALTGGGLAPRPGVDALIRHARETGLRLAVATTTNLPNVEALCQCFWDCPATEIFEVIAAGDQVKAKKPAADVYDLALRRLGLGAADCLALEDSRNGLRAAKAAGLRVVITPSAYTAHEDFSGAELIVANLTDPRLAALLAA